MSETTNRSPGAVLPPWRIAQLTRQAVIINGARVTAERMGISDTTVARIAARLPCHRGSILQAARALGVDLDGCIAAERERLRQEHEDEDLDGEAPADAAGEVAE